MVYTYIPYTMYGRNWVQGTAAGHNKNRGRSWVYAYSILLILFWGPRLRSALGAYARRSALRAS